MCVYICMQFYIMRYKRDNVLRGADDDDAATCSVSSSRGVLGCGEKEYGGIGRGLGER